MRETPEFDYPATTLGVPLGFWDKGIILMNNPFVVNSRASIKQTTSWRLCNANVGWVVGPVSRIRC